MDRFIQTVQALGNFSSSEIDLLLKAVTVKQFNKNDHLLKEGQVSSVIYFLNHGSLQQYHVNEDGAERTLNLFLQGDWVLDYQSFISRKPTQNFIVAYEDAEVVEMDIYSLHHLIAQSQVFFKMGRLLETGIQPGNLYTQFSSPEERYREVLSKKPLWFQKFPLHLIASYLGVAPETLSRIRKRISIPAA